MGLDISLVRLTNDPTDDFIMDGDPPDLEFDRLFGHLKQSWQVDYGEGMQTISGYYHEELAYQRKGVKGTYHNRYKPDDFIVTKEQLHELMTYIDQDHIASFTNDFVDKFKEGDTIVLLSH